MSKTCCVEGCHVTADDVTYFPMPIKLGLLKKWREAMGSSNVNNYSLICSGHFTEEDYEHVRGKLRLKGKVVPSVFGNQTSQSPKKSQESEEKTTETNSEHTTETTQTKEIKTKANKKKKTRRRKKKLSETEEESENEGIEIEVPMFGGELLDVCIDDGSQENCTIECAPEALIRQESGTESEPELHKEDIEDIIANYHIKQDKKLAERLKPQDDIQNDKQATEKQDSDKQGNDKQGSKTQGNEKQGCDKQGNEKQDSVKSDTSYVNSLDDCVEVSFGPDEKSNEPVFVEISVGPANSTDISGRDDCLMLLEDVQVDIDPASLLLGQERDDDDDDEHRKEDPISLLTSSDESDVILEEPHIDTVEVSDETDEDDQPLVKLVKTPDKTEIQQGTDITKILWGTLYEYYCMHCQFKTTSKCVYQSHKELHTVNTVIQMCEVCNFTSASKSQFARHKKKHRDEKKYKCHLCEYKAKYNSSLIYHIKTHDQKLKLNKKFKGYRCEKCKYRFNDESTMLKHWRHCKCVRMHQCDKCEYATKRRSDLKRHKLRKHDFDGEDDEYVPPVWAD